MSEKEKFEHQYLTRVGFADPASKPRAGQRLKKVRARQAIVVIGSDELERIFVLFAWAGRLATSRFIDKIIETCENWKPRVFGIEANAMQSLFADVVQDTALRQMKRLPIIGVNQTTKVEKDFRIRAAIEPVINSGRLFLLEKQSDLETELRGFPTAATKDIVDCLASAIALMPKRPKKAQRNEEIEQLAHYLRETGVPAHQIQRRIEELYGDTA